jgi:hypothetical protein
MRREEPEGVFAVLKVPRNLKQVSNPTGFFTVAIAAEVNHG